MKTWDVEIEWVAVATVRVEAETQEQAQVLASERGLPWQEAGEGYDGSQTHYTATCVEDEDEPSECECDTSEADNENPPDGWEECGGCGSWHPANFGGDCRDDAHRWPFAIHA